MTTHKVALNFEDGVTRFIVCDEEEVVATASYRSRINIPVDCMDGACGTCKSFCESGQYHLGYYIEEAMTEDEAAAGQVLTCQMYPESDCVVSIPASSDIAKTGVTPYTGKISAIHRLSDNELSFSIGLDNQDALTFLPGQYANITVPGTEQTRSFSFSSSPLSDGVSFLIRDTAYGALPSYLREHAKAGDAIQFTGPLGSFYLRDIKRPVIFLAGGTGLAPYLSMLEMLAEKGTEYPITLLYGVNTDEDLVLVDALERLAGKMPAFTFTCCVAADDSSYPNKGYVTRYFGAEQLNGGDVDVYVCGPPAMVEAVRSHIAGQGVIARSLYYERFSGHSAVGAIGEEHFDIEAADDAFEARVALELGAATMTVGRLDQARLAGLRRLAEATVPFVAGERFTDVEGYRQANQAFHTALIDCTGIGALSSAYGVLSIQDLMGQALTTETEVTPQVAQDHLDLVAAYEAGDLAAAHRLLVDHNERSKATMRAHAAAKENGPGST
ncbi:MAG: benzoate 1,2-dioxygenase electron transfer component BenC [Streptosporangiaceae bacterium]